MSKPASNTVATNNAKDNKANNTTDTPSGDDKPKRVLSIQSTVVFGVCGNKSAMFPLQLHEFDVSPMNTVQFSNHTAYPKWTGTISTGKEIDELVDGLQSNNLFTFPYLITGYMGGIDCLSHLNKLITTLKSNVEKEEDSNVENENDTNNNNDNNDKNKHKPSKTKLFYACDPVMGDNGKLYAQSFKPFIDVYKNEIIKHADLLTPNQTEASFLLNNLEIKSLNDAYNACCKFHQEYDIRYVVITSIDIPTEKDKIYVVFSDKLQAKKYGYLKIDKIKGYWVGTGDLTTALLFSWIDKNPDDLTSAVQNTVATVTSIINRTKENDSKELMLIGKKSMNDILEPTNLPKATIVNI